MPGDERTHRTRRRSLSPREHDRKHRHRSPPSRKTQEPVNVKLSFGQRTLHKADFEVYEGLFADYLDVQKRLDIHDLDRDEIKGRWKSFIKRWNTGQLAEGWYDPARQTNRLQGVPLSSRPAESRQVTHYQSNPPESDDDEYGPVRPGYTSSSKQGPRAPGLQDLQHKRELDREQQQADAEYRQYERKQERKAQSDRLDELAPRADPGSKERQREKRQETTTANRAFAEAKDAGAVEIADADLMGDDGIAAYKAQKQAMARQKNERELRREEVLRARAAEREEKLAEHRAKEEKTMQALKALAQQRFG